MAKKGRRTKGEKREEGVPEESGRVFLANLIGLKKPLPVNDVTDTQALDCYLAISSNWKTYQSPKSTEEQRAKTARAIKNMYDALPPKKKPGRRSKTVELEPHIENVFREGIRIQFRIYRKERDLAIKEGVLKKREKDHHSYLIGHLLRWEKLFEVRFAEGWQSRFEQLIWTGRRRTSGFVNDAMAALTGHTKESLKAMQQRKQKK